MVTNRRRERQDGKSDGGWHFLARFDSRRVRRASFLIMACWLFLNGSARAPSQDADTVEYPVKLAFLYNFTKFVEWPASSFRDAGAPLALCIVGEDPFSSELESELRSRTVRSRPVSIIRLRSTDNLSTCHIVFIPVMEKHQAARIVRGLKESSTLTVGEFAGFAAQGGIINFVVEGNRLRFEVNTFNAERAGLKISSKLLNLAEIVPNSN